jgi:carbon-monoxide dehydrogenase medium subunit
MKPAPFQYYAPTTVEEVLTLLNEHGYEAKVLAGGQSLVPTMNFRLAQPAVIIDLNRISELSYVETETPGELRLGAMVRQREAERNSLFSGRAPLVYETMPYIAHPQIRNRGTFGGSIAHADPAAELPVVMSALGARFKVRRLNDQRWVSVDEFYLGMFTTALEAEELLVEIAIPPLQPRSGWAFREIARRHGDYALVGLAAVVTLDSSTRCQDARIVFLSVGDGPVQAPEAVKVLVGEIPSEETIRAAAETAANVDIDPGNDIHASAVYRRHLAKVLTAQALTQAFERAGNT